MEAEAVTEVAAVGIAAVAATTAADTAEEVVTMEAASSSMVAAEVEQVVGARVVALRPTREVIQVEVAAVRIRQTYKWLRL